MDEQEPKDRSFKYSNGEIIVVWKPWLCEHSAHCYTELPEVFHPMDRPWITPKDADSDTIIVQVSRCPSGALSIRYPEFENENE